MITNKTVQTFLAGRGKVGVPTLNYVVAGDESADTPSPVAFPVWDVSALGAAPTPADIAAMRTASFTSTSRQKDILALVALVVRAKGLAAWNAMTTPQKVAATLAEADVWSTIRDFIETNV